MRIWCCGCQGTVEPRLTDGAEIYPHRPDLAALPFWRCDNCANHVGCHNKTSDPTRPLGTIPTPELRRLRRELHEALDPLRAEFGVGRSKLYRLMGRKLDMGTKSFHAANLRSAEEARKAIAAAREIREDLSARSPRSNAKSLFCGANEDGACRVSP